MPRFFFHFEDGQSLPDEDGMVLPDLPAARIEAVMRLGEMLRAQPHLFCNDGALQLVLTDEGGMTLMTLDVTATLAPAYPAEQLRGTGS